MILCTFSPPISSVQLSSVVSDSLRPHGLQHARLPYPSPTPGACPDSCPSSQWCHPTISPSVLPSPPAFSLSQHQGLFKWVTSSHQVAKVLEFQHQSFQWIFRTDFLSNDWFDLFAVQETLKSLFQHHSLKALPTHSCLLEVVLILFDSSIAGS